MRSFRSAAIVGAAVGLATFVLVGCAAPRTPEPAKTLPARVQYRTIDVDGISIFYREAGPTDAPTLLLLHGFPSSSHMFRDLIADLASDFHLIAPDYPGFGNSDAPAPECFAYTFDHLTDVMEGFVRKVGLRRFALYMQDFGGPVGFRLATRRPEWISALVIQNANAYEEGLSVAARDLLRPFAEGKRTPEVDAKVLGLFRRETTIAQYKTGARHPDAISPDAWNMDQAVLDRPGSSRIQLELHANYVTNIERYPEWQAYFARHQPPALVVWGKGDPFFTVDGAKAYARDLTSMEVHILDTGHFALEEDHAVIAGHIRRFFREKGVR